MGPIRFIIAGDYSPRERVQTALDENCYMELFPSFPTIVESADYSIVNFESSIPLAGSLPIPKIGTHLECRENALELLNRLGFKMVTLANNHFADYGVEGIENSLRLFLKYGIESIGAGRSLHEARMRKVIQVKEKRVSIINACEHEFSISRDGKAGCNPLDIIGISRELRTAKSETDYSIVILHGGHEHYQLPSPRMKQLFRFLVEQGADVVINHHQHCFSGYEVYNNKPIFYGLGNFCFDSQCDIESRSETFCYGYMVELILDKTISFKLYPYEQCYRLPGVYLLKEEALDRFKNQIKKLNNAIQNDNLLSDSFQIMSKARRDLVYQGFLPYCSRVALSLYYRGLLPSFLRKKRLLMIKSVIECESHYDILTDNLDRELV